MISSNDFKDSNKERDGDSAFENSDEMNFDKCAEIPPDSFIFYYLFDYIIL